MNLLPLSPVETLNIIYQDHQTMFILWYSIRQNMKKMAEKIV